MTLFNKKKKKKSMYTSLFSLFIVAQAIFSAIWQLSPLPVTGMQIQTYT
jgi:heme/copper-type cytochrome/quinol oxidase subunit 4